MNKLFENWNRYLKEDEQLPLPIAGARPSAEMMLSDFLKVAPEDIEETWSEAGVLLRDTLVLRHQDDDPDHPIYEVFEVFKDYFLPKKLTFAGQEDLVSAFKEDIERIVLSAIETQETLEETFITILSKSDRLQAKGAGVNPF